MYHLQNRWKPEGRALIYYGMRNRENLFRNRVRLTGKQAAVINKLPCELSRRELRILRRLIGTQVVEEKDLRPLPSSIREAVFCTQCSANDFIIPGLEFDSDGRCPMCQTAEETKSLRSLVPIVDDIPRARKSRFDVALFYTGGKDSTYMLYYLSKVKKLRVLALTWDIPFMSECARQSIENAKRHFDTVEFISRTVMREDMLKIYTKLYELSENTCACPSLAYALFYPELVSNRVPYFMAGNEPAQILGLYYNHMAPKIAYAFPDNRFLQFLVNAGRVLTLHPPLRRGQFHTLSTMKQLTKKKISSLTEITGYRNELVSNIVAAIGQVPELVEPLRRAIRYSSRSGNIPAFVHLDFNDISGGEYNWRAIRETIISECGWVAPDDTAKGLHTSCQIEKCKEYSQFSRFYSCRSKMIPFSALEISIASRSRNLTREEAIAEMEQSLGFSLEEIPECAIMSEFLGDRQ